MAVADARLPSSWLNSPKLDRLDDTEFRLYVAGLMYCNLHLTDGKILVPALRYLHPDGARRDVADRLCSKQAWSYREGLEPHWLVVDYFPSQISKRQFEKDREAARLRSKRYRDSQKTEPDGDTERDASRDGARDGERKKGKDRTRPALEVGNSLEAVPDFIRANDEAMDRLNAARVS